MATMSASDQGIAGVVCGKWMPREKTHRAQAYPGQPSSAARRGRRRLIRSLVGSRHPGPLAQWERVSLTRRRSEVQILYGPPGKAPRSRLRGGGLVVSSGHTWCSAFLAEPNTMGSSGLPAPDPRPRRPTMGCHASEPDEP
jgi:hypothetical protein